MDAQKQTPLQRVGKVSRLVRISYILLMVLVAVPVFSDLCLLWGEAGYGIEGKPDKSYSLSRERLAYVQNIPDVPCDSKPTCRE